eukprot:1025995_1
MVSTVELVFVLLSMSMYKTSIINGCIVTFDAIQTTFDLCSTSNTSYQVVDSRNINYEDMYTSTNYHYYKYYFNPLGSVPISFIPPICLNATDTGYCSDESNCTTDTELLPISDPSWAYQIWFNASTDTAFRCYHLTNEFGGPPMWSLYHDADPSLGIQLTYMNGDHSNCNRNRKFTIQFLCSDQPFAVPSTYPLHEYAQCEYTLELSSIHGCPIQCKQHANKLCGGNGICGFDWTDNAPRCFCYHQWSGTDCSIPDDLTTLANNSFKTHPNQRSPFVLDPKHFGADIGVIYDLSAFAIDNEVYVVNSLEIGTNYTYYVGVPYHVYPPSMGGTVLPSLCDDIMQWCAEIDTVTGECLSGDTFGTNRGYVFRVNWNTNECLCLGKRETFLLYDEGNPSAGLTAEYTRGSWCESGAKNMEFRIHLVCPKDQDKVYHPRNETQIELYEYVEQDDDAGCIYSFTYYTAIACPYQCITESTEDNVETFTVCQQHGICAADPNAGFVRCLCDNGWTGVDCQERMTINPTQDPTFNPTQNPTWNPSVSPSFDPNVSPRTSAYHVETTSLLIAEGYSEMIWMNNAPFFTAIIVIGVVVLVILLGFFVYAKTKPKHLSRIPSTECMTENTITTDTAKQSLVDHGSDQDDDDDVETGRTLGGDELVTGGAEKSDSYE